MAKTPRLSSPDGLLTTADAGRDRSSVYGVAVVVCAQVDAPGRPVRFVDRPAGVDPCGENGEVRTVVTDGPPFTSPLTVERGWAVDHEGGGGTFRYLDPWLR